MATGQIEPLDGVLDDHALVDGDRVRHTITRVKHQSCALTIGHQREDSLRLEEARAEIVLLKKTLSDTLPVVLRVEGCLSDQKELIRFVLFKTHL